MRIVLIGFMGSGKSTVGAILAEKMQWPLFEMDSLVLEEAKCKEMRELFEKGGETLLREVEERVAQKIMLVEQGVIATGGGVILNPKTMTYLQQNRARFFFLHFTFQTLAFRLQEDQSRPLFKKREEAESLYYLRQPLYRDYADEIIDGEGKSIEEIANEIWRAIHLELISK